MGTTGCSATRCGSPAASTILSENIVHLVLAKIPGGPPGVKGISLFLVPRVLPSGERNDIALAGLNHKMGCRGAVNTLLNFGEGKWTPAGEAGAVGYLVGRPHEGLSCMFHMMNEARVGVGAGATALGYAGYLEALEYAKTRLQGRRRRDEGPVDSAGADHRAHRRPPNAVGGQVLCGRRPCAHVVLRATARRTGHGHHRRRAQPGESAARGAHSDRQELAIAVVPCRQRPGDPSAWRVWVQPRIRRRAALPRQPPESDSRRHTRNPGHGPSRPQGRHARWRRVGAVD